MTEWQVVGALAAFGMFIIAVITNVVLVTSRIGSIKTDIVEKISQIEKQRDVEISQLRQMINDIQMSTNLKIFQIETFIRDTFLRKDSFKEITAEIAADIQGLNSEMRSRFMRIEAGMIKWSKGKIDEE